LLSQFQENIIFPVLVRIFASHSQQRRYLKAKLGKGLNSQTAIVQIQSSCTASAVATVFSWKGIQ
jgi:hypothetical protein